MTDTVRPLAPLGVLLAVVFSFTGIAVQAEGEQPEAVSDAYNYQLTTLPPDLEQLCRSVAERVESGIEAARNMLFPLADQSPLPSLDFDRLTASDMRLQDATDFDTLSSGRSFVLRNGIGLLDEGVGGFGAQELLSVSTEMQTTDGPQFTLRAIYLAEPSDQDNLSQTLQIDHLRGFGGGLNWQLPRQRQFQFDLNVIEFDAADRLMRGGESGQGGDFSLVAGFRYRW